MPRGGATRCVGKVLQSVSRKQLTIRKKKQKQHNLLDNSLVQNHDRAPIAEPFILLGGYKGSNVELHSRELSKVGSNNCCNTKISQRPSQKSARKVKQPCGGLLRLRVV